MQIYYLGLDGTDSSFGGCTTWTMSNIIDRLVEEDSTIKFLNFPRLIRLNPNVPEKTRGNGALSLHIQSKFGIDRLGNLIVQQIRDDQSNYELDLNKKPGLVILKLKPSTEFYYHALHNYLTIDTLAKVNADYIWPEINQSHIGAIAAIASDLSNDYTFELLGYRKLENCGDERVFDLDTLLSSLKKTTTSFSNYDIQQNRELIAPSGPDPVFCGIRGNNPSDLKTIFEGITIREELSSYTIFQTNQATDSHVNSIYYSNNAKEVPLSNYHVFSGLVKLLDNPREIEGGHVFSLALYLDKVIELAWFEPTKELRNKARLLAKNDIIYIHGNIHIKEDSPINIHVEFMSIVDVEPIIKTSSPICDCGNRMTSAGKFSGYKCRECGELNYIGEKYEVARQVYPGERVYASKSAQRHLTRPLDRLHKYNRDDYSEISLSDFRVRFFED